VLDYCKQNGIDFWAYMVIEQGALSGKYDSRNPMPEESDRGKRYNPVLDKLSVLTDAMKEIGKGYNISCSQVALAWALTKGTTPIVGATKEKHIVEAAGAIDIRLTQEEMRRLEQLAEATNIDTRGEWEHSME
jgi:myo-inositol catabolism protein IolS